MVKSAGKYEASYRRPIGFYGRVSVFLSIFFRGKAVIGMGKGCGGKSHGGSRSSYLAKTGNRSGSGRSNAPTVQQW